MQKVIINHIYPLSYWTVRPILNYWSMTLSRPVLPQDGKGSFQFQTSYESVSVILFYHLVNCYL